MQISGIKTKEDALAAIESFKSPEVSEKATDDQKVYAARQAVLVEAGKAFVKSRLELVPTDIKVVGIEVRAEVGLVEMFTMRIICHK